MILHTPSCILIGFSILFLDLTTYFILARQLLEKLSTKRQLLIWLPVLWSWVAKAPPTSTQQVNLATPTSQNWISNQYWFFSADIEIATKRILWGKFSNCGQTCVAPDYVLCDKEVQEKFVKCVEKYLKSFFGENIKQSKDYARIVNERHFLRWRIYLLNTSNYQSEKASSYQTTNMRLV